MTARVQEIRDRLARSGRIGSIAGLCPTTWEDDIAFLLSRVEAAENVVTAGRDTVKIRLHAMKAGMRAVLPDGPEQDLADALVAYEGAE